MRAAIVLACLRFFVIGVALSDAIGIGLGGGLGGGLHIGLGSEHHSTSGGYKKSGHGGDSAGAIDGSECSRCTAASSVANAGAFGGSASAGSGVGVGLGIGLGLGANDNGNGKEGVFGHYKGGVGLLNLGGGFAGSAESAASAGAFANAGVESTAESNINAGRRNSYGASSVAGGSISGSNRVSGSSHTTPLESASPQRGHIYSGDVGANVGVGLTSFTHAGHSHGHGVAHSSSAHTSTISKDTSITAGVKSPVSVSAEANIHGYTENGNFGTGDNYNAQSSSSNSHKLGYNAGSSEKVSYSGHGHSSGVASKLNHQITSSSAGGHTTHGSEYSNGGVGVIRITLQKGISTGSIRGHKSLQGSSTTSGFTTANMGLSSSLEANNSAVSTGDFDASKFTHPQPLHSASGSAAGTQASNHAKGLTEGAEVNLSAGSSHALAGLGSLYASEIGAETPISSSYGAKEGSRFASGGSRQTLNANSGLSGDAGVSAGVKGGLGSSTGAATHGHGAIGLKKNVEINAGLAADLSGSSASSRNSVASAGVGAIVQQDTHNKPLGVFGPSAHTAADGGVGIFVGHSGLSAGNLLANSGSVVNIETGVGLGVGSDHGELLTDHHKGIYDASDSHALEAAAASSAGVLGSLGGLLGGHISVGAQKSEAFAPSSSSSFVDQKDSFSGGLNSGISSVLSGNLGLGLGL